MVSLTTVPPSPVENTLLHSVNKDTVSATIQKLSPSINSYFTTASAVTLTIKQKHTPKAAIIIVTVVHIWKVSLIVVNPQRIITQLCNHPRSILAVSVHSNLYLSPTATKHLHTTKTAVGTLQTQRSSSVSLTFCQGIHDMRGSHNAHANTFLNASIYWQL